MEEAIRLDDERAARRLQPTGVVQLVRGSAPYIELHQHSTMARLACAPRGHQRLV